MVDIKTLPSGVAVYATGTWPALKARDLLEDHMGRQRERKRGTSESIQTYRALALTPGQSRGRWYGDADVVFAKAAASGAKPIEAEYIFPDLAHAPMEPLDGYIRFDGSKALARLGSQIQTLDQGTIAGALAASSWY